MSSEYPPYPCCGGITFHRGGQKCDDYRMPPMPPPQAVDGPAVWDLVLEDMQARDRMGARKYGVRKRANDGRDHLREAYEEILDAACYLRAELFKRDGR